MIVIIKESIYVNSLKEKLPYVIRGGTRGVERNNLVEFYDGTKTVSVGFPKDLCVNLPELFKVSRTIEDREVAVRDVLRIIAESPELTKEQRESLNQRINIL